MPPHPLDAEWKMRVDGREYGPFTGRKLEEFADNGRLVPDTEVRRKDGGSWIPAKTDATLRGFFCEDVPLRARFDATSPSTVQAGDNSPVVQIHNNIGIPSAILDPGADRSPGLALFLSLLIVGLGQIYNGDVLKGVLMFFGCIFLWVAMLGWIINIWSMIDAYSRAKDLKMRHRMYLNATAVA